MKKRKKLLTVSLASLLMFSGTVFPISNALANEDGRDLSTINTDLDHSLQNSITNFKLIAHTENNVEYTYNEKGESFQVKEKFNADHTSVNSTIYKLDKNTNKYIVFEELTTNVNTENNTIELISTLNKSSEVINIDEISNQFIDKTMLNPINKFDDISTIQANYDWEYKNTEYGNNKFTRLTVAGIATVIATISKLHVGARLVVNLANTYFQIGVGQLYYIKHTYYDKNANKLRPRIKYVTHFYSDSGRKNLVQGHVTSIFSR